MRYHHVLLALLPFGCGVTVATRSVSESAQTRVKQAGTPEPLVGDLGFDELVELNLREHEALADENVGPGDVRKVHVSDLVLRVERPDGADLAFIDRLEFYASAPGLPEVLVASQSGFVVGETEVAFDLEDVDLTDYVMSDALTISTQVSGQTPDQSTTVKIDFTIDVGVTPKGACRNL
jgi:hypothetical protein